MSLMVSLYAEDSDHAYKHKEVEVLLPLTKVSKKKSDTEAASVARGLSGPRRMLSSAKDLDQVYKSDVGFLVDGRDAD